MTDPYATSTASAVTDNTITDKKLREAVIAACRELVQRGLAYGTSGNVSVRRNERSFFRMANRMRRTPASSSAAGIFLTRSPTEADHGD
jgi:hypothetical protein